MGGDDRSLTLELQKSLTGLQSDIRHLGIIKPPEHCKVQYIFHFPPSVLCLPCCSFNILRRLSQATTWTFLVCLAVATARSCLTKRHLEESDSDGCWYLRVDTSVRSWSVTDCAHYTLFHGKMSHSSVTFHHRRSSRHAEHTSYTPEHSSTPNIQI